MIYANGKEVNAVYYGKVAVQAIYKGTQLVWQALRSCFGAGMWVETKPWSDSEGWKE